MRHISDKDILLFLQEDNHIKDYQRISRHLKKCKKCRDTLIEWQKTIRVTESYIQQDKESMHIPHVAQVSESWQQEEEDFSWVRYWLKPAIATAAVVVLTILGLLIFPQPKENNLSDYSNRIILVSEYGYEAYEIDDEFFTSLEQAVLNTICEDQTLRNDILYSSLGSFEELISTEETQQIQETRTIPTDREEE
jgi:hypothetical protein